MSNVFEYDANGLRVKKTDSTGTSSFLLDGLSIVAQYAPSGARQAWYTQSLARIDEVLNVVNSTGKYWYQADALGSIYALTTASGGIQARGGYDVFGAPVAMGGTPVGQPFGFTGREHEIDAGLVYSRERVLDTATSRFGRPDPLGFVAGPNYYASSARGITLAGDPLGLFRTTPEAYAVTHPKAYLWLLADLGVISATAVATVFTLVSPYCDKDDDEGPIIYYRGLSVADVRELSWFGEISSKMRRGGGDIEDGFRAHMDGAAARQHIYTSRGSPYFSVTLSQEIARSFALGGPTPPKDPDDAASGVVVEFITRRPPARPGKPEHSEYLFFWMLGLKSEAIVPVEWH